MDVDGVIIRGEGVDPAIRRPWDDELRQRLGILPERLSEVFFKRHFTPLLRGEGDLKVALTKVLPELGYGGTADDIIQCWFAGDAKLDRTLLDRIGQLSGKKDVRIFLATNQEQYRATYIWEDLGMKNYFEGMFCSGNVGALKTEPAFYRHIHAKLNISPYEERVLFFDDSQKNIDTARGMGWDAFLYREVPDFERNPRIESLLLGSTAGKPLRPKHTP